MFSSNMGKSFFDFFFIFLQNLHILWQKFQIENILQFSGSMDIVIKFKKVFVGPVGSTCPFFTRF